ncbi:MAG: class I SAM-dependent methyltransferase [Hyphomicrobiaceae bacterium]|nr:class I SAM-dependent methyltransferase [Hyphomicrobiaceae bacterium]
MPTPPAHLSLVATQGFKDYALLDSGGGRKLERFGTIIVDRPEAQALWRPALARAEWSKAHAVFSASGEDDEKGRWRVDKPVPESWPVRIGPLPDGDVTMLCRMQGLWHLGLFPEQKPHWDWMVGRIKSVTAERPRVLNLFAYTGAASLIAAAAGAEVTHVDASKKSVAWGRENQAASKLTDKPIRWIVDDAVKFVSREVRRGRGYHVILVDPPKFGRGPDGEVWDLMSGLPALLRECAALLAPDRSAMILTVYAIRASALAFDQLMRETLVDRGGRYDTGELSIAPERGGFSVPTSLFTRWENGLS